MGSSRSKLIFDNAFIYTWIEYEIPGNQICSVGFGFIKHKNY